MRDASFEISRIPYRASRISYPETHIPYLFTPAATHRHCRMTPIIHENNASSCLLKARTLLLPPHEVKHRPYLAESKIG
jgi:hypothetical protein